MNQGQWQLFSMKENKVLITENQTVMIYFGITWISLSNRNGNSKSKQCFIGALLGIGYKTP